MTIRKGIAVFFAHKDEKGRKLLQGMMIDKFVEIKDSAYDSIRAMNKWIEQNTAPSININK